jgi:hypothetical protein
MRHKEKGPRGKRGPLKRLRDAETALTTTLRRLVEKLHKHKAQTTMTAVLNEQNEQNDSPDAVALGAVAQALEAVGTVGTVGQQDSALDAVATTSVVVGKLNDADTVVYLSEILGRELKQARPPETWEAATVIGDQTAPEFVALLNQTVIAGTASPKRGKHMWGGGWTQITSTWKQAIDAWLTHHPEKATKGGKAFFFADSELNGPMTEATLGRPSVQLCFKTTGKIRALYAMMIDVDGGCEAEAVVALLRKAGICAVVYTTHSNIEKGGMGSDRFRVIVLLDKPFTLRPDPVRPDSSWGPDIAAWQALYAGVCDLIIPAGANVDSTGFTPSQLMYIPTRPVGAAFKHYVVVGGGLDLSTITPGDPKKYEAPSVRTKGVGGDGSSYNGEPAFLSDRFNLKSWHSDNRTEFMLSMFLDHAGWAVHGASGGGHDITCPNHAAHTSGSDDAWVIDGPDADTSGAISCFHDHCKGLHTTDFIKMIEDQIDGLPDQYEHFSDMLCDEIFYADMEEKVNREDYIPAPEPVVEWLDTPKQVGRAFKALTDKSPEAAYSAIWAGVLWADSVAGAVDKFNEVLLEIKRYKDRDRTRIKSAGKVMMIAKATANSEKKEAEAKATVKAQQAASGVEPEPEIPNVAADVSFRTRCWMIHRVMTVPTDDPKIFHRNERLVDIQIDEYGKPNIRAMTDSRYKAYVETRINFDGKPAERDDINWVVNQPRTDYPALRGVTAAPVFGPDMSLITTPGYHKPSGLYYAPKVGAVVPPVSEVPDVYELASAVNSLVDVLADFPFDGLTTRAEVVAAVGNGENVPSFCQALSIALSVVCRMFINGPVPWHFVRKAKPRTGATKMVGVLTQMALLTEGASVEALPTSEEEMNKTLMATLDSGEPFYFPDNISPKVMVDSGNFAAFLTANPYYSGRRIGTPGKQKAENKTVTVSSGNQPKVSEELAARILWGVLDPKMEKPSARTGFKYNLDTHMPQYAPLYLHALLTLVQHWKAQGCPLWAGEIMGGFDQHNTIIGGILDAAGIMGFRSNAAETLEATQVDSPTDMVMDAMITEYHKNLTTKKQGTVFRVWGKEVTVQKTKDENDVMVEAPFAKCLVESIKELAQANSIAIPGGGYDRNENNGVVYNDSARNVLPGVFGAMVGTVREWHAERDEGLATGAPSQQGRYVLQRHKQDKHGVIYDLEVLPLVG